MNDSAPQREMPRYECHKKVHALKIKRIVSPKGNGWKDGMIITPEDEGYAPFEISQEWVNRACNAIHGFAQDLIGGYYVVYDGGYTSFSPAKAFEEGYTRI